MPSLLYPSLFKRSIFFILLDILIIILSLYFSFLLRFEFALADEYKRLIVTSLPFFIIIKVATFLVFRMYRITWRYVGLRDLSNIVRAVLVSESLLMFLIIVLLREFPGFLSPELANFVSVNIAIKGFPRSIFFIDGAVSLLLLSGLRISKRVFIEVLYKNGKTGDSRRTIIVGAGNTGEMILRDMLRPEVSDFYPIGFLDDDNSKIGTYIHGIKVFSRTEKLKAVIRKYKVEAVIIAIPSLNYKTLRRIYGDAKEAQISTIKIVPRIYDFQKPIVNIKDLEDISMEDLIGRQVVEVDYKEIEHLLKDKVILVTGAGGSIGSEIVMQVCAFRPQKVILFDIDETALHNMHIRLARKFPYLKRDIYFMTGDIRDEERVEEVFREFIPQIVFHAAAYKHVPMMESNPKEAVKVNIFGTYIFTKISVSYGVGKFIMISTDKAVRPTSVMGATKRIAEYICNSANSQNKADNGKTKFVSVRFGNVLGSRGSVLPLFFEQLKHGGPLTVTHKDVQRYFMTIPEAVSLVLQASVIGNGGEVLALDMGEPVRIVELAEELIRIHGLQPYKDVDIEFIGLRQGEKLFEETLAAEEGVIASKHEKVFIAKGSEKYSKEEIEGILDEFRSALSIVSESGNNAARELLKKYVKYYTSCCNK
ncbi:MAG: polysaccharide biosynthesis protein [Nitrospirae bacterium]|nr:polysaccharide biosynthesis protein [Nitrospirota bacterium]